MRAALAMVAAAGALLGGCQFNIGAVPADGSVTVGPQSTPAEDGGADAAAPSAGEVEEVLFPSHVARADLDASSADWVIGADTTIDTGKLTIYPAPPSGVRFAAEAGLAVLEVHDLVIEARVRVTGTRPLVVIAGDHITVDGTLDGGGRQSTPGPGARTSPTGGQGQAGAALETDGTGGGGGGFAAPGAQGGAAFDSGSWVDGARGGGIYGIVRLSDAGGLNGGAAGGRGTRAKDGDGTCTTPARAGAGGGAIQLSARGSVEVGALGTITVAGGGGAGGCAGATQSGSGAGGGSGGSLLIEAPTLRIKGVLLASGGGGGAGGGAYVARNQTILANGGDGNDGFAAQAQGSAGGLPTAPLATNAGGQGASAGAAVTGGGAEADSWFGGGGGGGAFGRIELRAHEPPGAPGASPNDPTLVTDLPAAIP